MIVISYVRYITYIFTKICCQWSRYEAWTPWETSWEQFYQIVKGMMQQQLYEWNQNTNIITKAEQETIWALVPDIESKSGTNQSGFTIHLGVGGVYWCACMCVSVCGCVCRCMHAQAHTLCLKNNLEKRRNLYRQFGLQSICINSFANSQWHKNVSFLPENTKCFCSIFSCCSICHQAARIEISALGSVLMYIPVNTSFR